MWVAVQTEFHTFMKRMIYFIEEIYKYYRSYTFERWELDDRGPFPLSDMAHLGVVKVINMSLEEYLEKELCFPCYYSIILKSAIL